LYTYICIGSRTVTEHIPVAWRDTVCRVVDQF